MTKHKSLAKWQLLLAVALFIFVHDASADEKLTSASALEFANGGRTLFVADSDGGKIFAFELNDRQKAKASTPFNVISFSHKVAKLAGVNDRHVSFHDLAVHPVSGEAFVSMSIAKDGKRTPGIAVVSQDGSVSMFDMSSTKSSSSIALTQTPDDDVVFWRDIPAASFTVTDLDFRGENLYVSGLSTGEFASTLRKIPYPFNNSQTTTRVEIFHTLHGQIETRAPIRALEVVELEDEEHVVAVYTCTPLVTIPTSSLKDGVKISGKTIAELGFGNTPLEIVTFAATNQQQVKENFILIINKERGADLIKMEDVVAGNKKEGLKQPSATWGHMGIPSRLLPLSGVMQADDQDEQFLAMLRRNISTGDVDLISFRKGAYMRLSDFVSEYNFDDYKYLAKEQEGFRQYQNMLKNDEGFSKLARESDLEKRNK